MTVPVKPAAPEPALRSNPATFSGNAEASIQYLFSAFPNWIELIAQFVEEQKEAAEAAAAAAGASDGFNLEGRGGYFFRVNSGETATEFASPADARTGLGATDVGSAVFTAANQAAGRTALGASTVGNGVFTAGSAEAARSALVAPARPRGASGLGQWGSLTFGVGSSAVLPSGGTYAYFFMRFNSGSFNGGGASVAAGGTTVFGAENFKFLFFWRVA